MTSLTFEQSKCLCFTYITYKCLKSNGLCAHPIASMVDIPTVANLYPYFYSYY